MRAYGARRLLHVPLLWEASRYPSFEGSHHAEASLAMPTKQLTLNCASQRFVPENAGRGFP